MTWQAHEQLEAGDTYALCRCGRSGDKPLCDGTHRKIGFREERAATDGTGTPCDGGA
ncbi:CDGSH iron-sulfur domain-containing protein [Streptosporangium algeriense]|uniref:CDGSH iron-sulfur domain-containing protein n=1 Tax=Streptosporangium algeriense TaxID=1682748 RepID=A0ABW3DSP1_9ACTN